MGNNQIAPPWVAFEGISPLDMFWRMGKGEDYMDKFSKWYFALSADERREYISANPAPEEWSGFYDD